VGSLGSETTDDDDDDDRAETSDSSSSDCSEIPTTLSSSLASGHGSGSRDPNGSVGENATAVSPAHASSGRCSKVREEEHSIVSETFEGELCSQIRCAKCKHVSSTHDRFWDVSLSIPSSETLQEMRTSSRVEVGSLRRFTNWVG
jgi:ubiquitin C-terminal hydrolase